MDRLLNAMTIACGAVILLVLVSVRRAHIRVEYSVSWLLAAAALVVLSRADGVLHSLARYLGFLYPPLVLLRVVGCVFVIMFYGFSIVISWLRDDNFGLGQRMAILEDPRRALWG